MGYHIFLTMVLRARGAPLLLYIHLPNRKQFVELDMTCKRKEEDFVFRKDQFWSFSCILSTFHYFCEGPMLL